ncbi:MAG TPA: nuclear transport factor 2 family protein [Candidatus Polarisedimenticolia bacterium]|nr:nuclear transport factor 2 family protein [Candidatus Polarisedimenticolia bacterium]
MAALTRSSQPRPAAARRFVALALIIVPALVSIPACRSGGEADADAIRALVAREIEATNHKDLKALAQIWSQEKGILLFDVSPPGRFEGWESIGHLFKSFFDSFSEIHLTCEGVKVQVQGGIGFATYEWAMTGRMGDYDVNDRGQATAVYKKEKDGWRLVHAHYSSVPPAQAGAEPGVTSREPPSGAAATTSEAKSSAAAAPASVSPTPGPKSAKPGTAP